MDAQSRVPAQPSRSSHSAASPSLKGSETVFCRVLLEKGTAEMCSQERGDSEMWSPPLDTRLSVTCASAIVSGFLSDVRNGPRLGRAGRSASALHPDICKTASVTQAGLQNSPFRQCSHAHAEITLPLTLMCV